jgi:hypothetical protein
MAPLLVVPIRCPVGGRAVKIALLASAHGDRPTVGPTHAWGHGPHQPDDAASVADVITGRCAVSYQPGIGLPE